MICQACNQDHMKMTEWCDRSFLEIERDHLNNKIEELKAENARYREALKHISLEDDDLTDCCLKAIDKNYLYAHYHVIAEDALKGVSK
jgi:hypothetical protein